MQIWQEILTHYYPVRPKPSLTMEVIHTILPVILKYDIRGLFEDIVVSFNTPNKLDPDPSSPNYVIKMLKLVDHLQLYELKKACLGSAVALASDGFLGLALLKPVELSAAEPSAPPRHEFNDHFKGLKQSTQEELLAEAIAYFDENI